MERKFIDVHCHIQFDQYKEDDAQLIEQMRERGVVGIVVGVDYESSQKAVQLAEKHEHLFAAVGLHPNREKEEWYEVEKYRILAKHPKVVAMGECGLDYFRPVTLDAETKKGQQHILYDQLRLATELDKPLIIHSRPSTGTQDAYHDLIKILEEKKKTYPNLRGDIHFFVGGVNEAKAFIALGFTVSFTAVITFTRDYDAIIKEMPLESILSETDAPYVAPKSRRGKRNDPLAVEEVVARLADIRGEDRETVQKTLVLSAERLFALPRGS